MLLPDLHLVVSAAEEGSEVDTQPLSNLRTSRALQCGLLPTHKARLAHVLPPRRVAGRGFLAEDPRRAHGTDVVAAVWQ
jgi:hypothetical protein